MEPAPPPHPNAAARAFWLAFAATVLPPLLTFGLAAIAPGESGLTVLVVGAGLSLLIDAVVLILGIVRLASGRAPEGWSLLLGLLAGAVVGFGGCTLLLGVV